MATAVEQGMMNLIKVFHTYASKGGDPKKLDKRELRALFNAEFPSFVAECKDTAKLEKFLSELDLNKDGQVDFNEFMVLVIALTIICNQIVAEQL